LFAHKKYFYKTLGSDNTLSIKFWI